MNDRHKWKEKKKAQYRLVFDTDIVEQFFSSFEENNIVWEWAVCKVYFITMNDDLMYLEIKLASTSIERFQHKWVETKNETIKNSSLCFMCFLFVAEKLRFAIYVESPSTLARWFCMLFSFIISLLQITYLYMRFIFISFAFSWWLLDQRPGRRIQQLCMQFDEFFF